jgi:hypothetical protein
MGTFYSHEQWELDKLRMLREMIDLQPLHDSPCQLLDSQLRELEVMTSKFQDQIRVVRKIVKEHIK